MTMQITSTCKITIKAIVEFICEAYLCEFVRCKGRVHKFREVAGSH